jgi:hypothetical protein
MPGVKTSLAVKKPRFGTDIWFSRARDQYEREPNGHPIVSRRVPFDQRPIMFFKRIDPLISTSHALVGDLLWIGAIGFILAIIFGVIGASPSP